MAFSGGRDSTALLHATVQQAAPLGLSVVALHVHHGLSPHADAWLAHCDALCRRWARRGLPLAFEARRVDARPAPGDSIEAWARGARYRALSEMARERGVDIVLLAHHRRDQAETFLLQALRGGGAAALAAMPKRTGRDGITWARPWLAYPREAIETYARRHRLRWIDDESNGDQRLARNRLRLRVWPTLLGEFSDAESSLAAAAMRVAHASELLDEIAAGDVATLVDDRGLDLARWRALSSPRQRQALLHWLRGALATAPPSTLVDRLMAEASSDRDRRWPIRGGELRSYRGRLQPISLPARAAGAAEPLVVDLSRPGDHALDAWRGCFRVERVVRGGIAIADAAHLVLRGRQPGDRFQAGARRPPRSLKLQFQSLGVAPALRDGPIACRPEDDVPVFVPGLGIDARAVAPVGEEQVALRWLPR